MLRAARAGRGGLRVGRRARCRQKLGLGLSPLEDRWSNCLFFMIAAGYQPPLANVATQPPRDAASVATAPERRSWMSASPVTSVRRQPPRTVRERPRPSARMATGRQVQLTKQVGEYLVAAELSRRGLLTATFAGNVPDYDIVATGGRGQTALVQVKAIAGPSWQFDIRTFVDVRCQAGAQTMGQPTTPPAGDLICVLVRLHTYGADRFYVLRWPELQRVLINGYRGYLERHGGRRPKRADSFHTALRETHIEPFLDNWSLFDAFTEVSKTDPGTPGGPSAPHQPPPVPAATGRVPQRRRAGGARRCCMKTLCGWGGLACTSRDPPQESHYRDEVEGSSHVQDEISRGELAGLQPGPRSPR